MLLRLEGLFVLIAASAAFVRLATSWWLFAALFLAPDLSMLGYLAGRKAFACIAWGVLGPALQVLAVGLIWAAHIGFDRAPGFGLKYADSFGASHLSLMGKARSAKPC